MDKIRKNIESIFLIGSIVKILGLLYKIILARILKLDGMTIYALVFPALSLSLCLSSFSIPIVTNQNISSNNVEKKHTIRSIIKGAFRINIITTSIVSIMVLLSFPLFKYIYNEPQIYIPLVTTIPLIFCSNMSGIMKGYLEANKEFKITQLSNLYEQLLKILVSIFAIYLTRNMGVIVQVTVAYAAISVSEIASCIYLFYKTFKTKVINYRETQTDHIEKKLLKQAAPLTLEHFIVTLSSFVEPFIFVLALRKVSIPEDVAKTFFALETSYAIPLLIMAQFASLSVAKAAFPFFCENKNNLTRKNLYIGRSLFFCLIFAMLNFNICFFFQDITLEFMFNDTLSAPIVKFLSPFFISVYFTPIFISLMQAYNLEKKFLITSTISQIVCLLLIYLLCSNPMFNTNGFTIAIAATALLKFLLYYLIVRKYVGYKVKITSLLLIIILFLFNLIITTSLLSINPILNFLLSNSLCLLLLYLYYYLTYKKKRKTFHQNSQE